MLLGSFGRAHGGQKFREAALDGPKVFRILPHPSMTVSRTSEARRKRKRCQRKSKFDPKQAFHDPPIRLVTLSKRKSLAEPVTETTKAGCLKPVGVSDFAVAAVIILPSLCWSNLDKSAAVRLG
jgi:hypothetical protein